MHPRLAELVDYVVTQRRVLLDAVAAVPESFRDDYDLLRRDRHMGVPDPVSPRGEYTAAEGLAALAVSRESLLNAIRSGDGLALRGLTFEHPLLGSLDLYQWILFVGQHEARHAQQIAEIGRNSGGSTV